MARAVKFGRREEGSDMLVNCAAYHDGRKLADIGFDQVPDYLNRADCFVWVALSDASEEEIDAAGQLFHLHELAIEDAMASHQRPKVEEYGDCLAVIMQLVELEGDDVNIGEVDVFVGRNYVLSVRNHSKAGFLGVRKRCEEEPHLLRLGPAFVLYALMDAVVERYFPVLEALEEEVESIEAEIFNKSPSREIIERLYDLKLRLVALRHAATPLMEDIHKLFGGRVPTIVINLQDYFRDVADHLLRINAGIDAMRENIATAIQINLSLVTFEAGEVNKRLAAYAGIFAAATMFAGIWGMNFKGMPELEWEYGYPMALLVIVGISGFLFWRFRRAGWL
jgi:magnesium transporter